MLLKCKRIKQMIILVKIYKLYLFFSYLFFSYLYLYFKNYYKLLNHDLNTQIIR